METAISSTAPSRGALLGGDALRKLLAFAALILLIVVFSVMEPTVFPTWSNAKGVLLATAVNGVLALGVTFVIITAGLDLSVGTTMTFTAVMAGLVITNWGLPVWLGVLGAIGAGALAGSINGVVIAKMKIPPFIATLGMFYVTRGLALVLSELRPIYFNDSPSFQAIAMGSVTERIIPGFDLPNAVLIFFGAAVVASIILNRTILGRYTFALGSNEEATRLSGVTVDRWKILVY
ncbi:MAG: ABC transporter permease, partial [Caldilineaceae bacterium]